MKESIRINAIETRGLLISKRWVQAVAIVMLFSFFVLGLLAYRTYTDQAPIQPVAYSQQSMILRLSDRLI
jgi:nitric oxide reductase subunit B